MRRWVLALLMFWIPLAACAQETPQPLKTEKDRLSYALGMDLGIQMKVRSVELDPAVFARALNDAMSGGKTLLTEAEAKVIIAALQKSMIAKQAELTRTVGDKNKKEGEAFLAANKAKEGVVTLPSGVQYKILTAGTGKKPIATDTVVCQYRGTLIDGKEFDSSFARKEPLTFPVTRVIRGWTEILQLMPVGSKWQVVVPSALAYGEAGSGPLIGPHATLIFELELLAIK